MATKIEIDDMITVGALAEVLMIPVSKLIGELMKNGVMATINERIDFDTAQIIVGEMGLDVDLEKRATTTDQPVRKKGQNREVSGTSRPPVVAVMGHVDHGKTSLLDAIRDASVVKGESGGITQHISAYQIEHDKRKITFLDTPGHEAFAALREHGAQLTDLVIIVVAADDGVKPQTIEAIRYARKAGVKILVAINKIDKEAADPNIVKQQLSEHDLLVEEWGGDTIALPVSAKTKQGIPELLDMVLLLADVEDLKADDQGAAEGIIIEAHMEQGRGPVAVALVEAGQLRPGQFLHAGSSFAKVRNLETTTGQPITVATPSTPVVITGFKTLPEFGDEFKVASSEKAAKEAAARYSSTDKTTKLNMTSNELIRVIDRTNMVNQLNIIVKADVQGSLTSVIDSLKAFDTEEVAVRIVGSGIGVINANDVRMAASSNAIIYGFHVDLPTNIKRLASRDKVSVRLYSVIYELLDDAKDELSNLLAPEVIETVHGRLVVKGIFKTTKTDLICGGEVTKGKLVAPSMARIIRDKEVLAEAEVTNLKRGPQDASEVVEGEMCGMNLATEKRVDLQEGDHIEVFTRETKSRSL